MRAMILAAGRGERMGQLTLNMPKPLLRVAGKYLIDYPINQLVKAGVTEIVINIAHFKDQIKQALGDGKRYGATFFYSEEGERLETGGGICQALPLLTDETFLVMSGDIISDYPLQNLPHHISGLAHLVMVDNPVFHSKGDFGLEGGYLNYTATHTLTFANIGVYSRELFASLQPHFFPLSQLLLPAILKRQISGEYFKGKWINVGTPQDLHYVQGINLDL